MATYLQILNTIKDTALAQPNVNSVVREFLDLNREDAKYSAVVIQDRDGSRDRIVEQDYITYTWHLGYVDRLTYDESNRDDIISTGINIINNIVNTIRNTWFPELEVSVIDRINTFDQRFTAQCAGVYVVLAVNAQVSDCIDSESTDIYDKFEVNITENGAYHFVPSGRPYGDIDIVVNVDNKKPEDHLVETITSNGSYSYTPEEGRVFSNADITVDVHPTESLSRTYTTNGVNTIIGEFNGGTVNVDVHPTESLSRTYTSNGNYDITGEFNGGTVNVDVHPSNKLVETITSNGTTDLSGEWMDASITVDVHPSISLSETYTSNGSYDITGEFNGGVITVDVPAPEFVTETLNVSANGTYNPGEGVDGYSQVNVNVPAPEFVTEPLNVSANGTYNPGEGVDGYSQVVVDVPQSVTGYTEKDITEKNYEIINLDNSASFVASSAFRNNTTIQTVNLLYATKVYNYAFYACVSLSQVNLPMCSILYSYAFGYCYSLTQVDIPVCSIISDYAFDNCKLLSQVSLPMCSIIRQAAFRSCYSLTQVNLPMCSYIDLNVFQSCYSLTQVSLPVCSIIRDNAFNHCSSLTQVSLPVCSIIRANAFGYCSSLSIITIGYSSVCSLGGSNVFRNTPIASGTGSIYVPASLVDAYKSAENWSVYSSRIFAIPS